jgi:hypothetical protein
MGTKPKLNKCLAKSPKSCKGMEVQENGKPV